MSDVEPSTEACEPEREAGVVLVWFALLLFALIAITALCVDIGLWYVEAVHVQKAADSAALAGAVHLPSSPTNAAATAKDTAAKNSYTDGAASGNVSVVATQVATQPNQLQVSVTKTFQGIFGAVFGIPNLRITRSATAQYETAVDMGSPANIFANEPVAPNDPTSSNTPPGSWSNVSGFTANMWGNIFGYRSPKGNGDARHAGVCSIEDLCVSNVNTEYSDYGYFYRVTVDASQKPAGAKLAIEVFDPAAVDVGDHCDVNSLGDATVRAAINPWTTKNGTVATDAATRYDWGDTSNRAGVPGAGTYCTGDSHDAGANPPLTTYVVRANTTPFDPTAAPVVNQGTCSGLQIPGFDKTLSGGPLTQGGAGYDPQLASVFRQWVPVCMFDPSTVPAGDYLLQIRTNVALGGSVTGPGTAPDTGGSNRFAIRAAWVTGGQSFSVGTYTSPPTYVNKNGLSIAGVGYMSLYANAAAGAAAPNFYMARVLPGGNQTLRVRLFDIGDCGGTCSPTLTFKKPSGAAWDSCKVRVGEANAFVTYAPCSFPNNGTNLWTTVDIAIPGTYTCSVGTYTDCWTTMTYSLASAGALNDTTTWSAQILGNPVRIVK